MEGALREGSDQPGLRLIETILWDGRSAPRWPLHADRMRRSAAALGWPCPPLVPPQGPATAARLRLTLDRTGRTEWETHPLPAAHTPWRLALSPHRLRADDPWLRIKTTRRAAYDAARATLPPGIEEVVFANECGEVCEGAITTLFFDRGAGMRTPPLSCGLLPGVLRAELSCPEEVLATDDLPHVRLWVGNALRGLIPAVWAG